jgi:hypothetical protein
VTAMTDEQETDGRSDDFLPPLDFSSIVFPLYSQALVKLGLLEDPLKKRTEENLELAKRLIDLLDLLKERTQGNLKEDEEKFLESCVLQLKMNYMQKAKIIKT